MTAVLMPKLGSFRPVIQSSQCHFPGPLSPEQLLLLITLNQAHPLPARIVHHYYSTYPYKLHSIALSNYYLVGPISTRLAIHAT